MVQVTLHCISATKPYGSDVAGSAGSVRLELCAAGAEGDTYFKPLQDLSAGVTVVDHEWAEGQPRHSTATVEVKEIQPQNVCTVSFPFRVRSDTTSRLFEVARWTLRLFIGGRKNRSDVIAVEEHTHPCRIVPAFNAEPDFFSDAVLATGINTDRREFLAWMYLLNCLDLSVNIWDTGRNGGFTSGTHGLEWVGRCDIVVVPVQLPYVQPAMLNRHDIERHFAARGRKAGLLVLGAQTEMLDHAVFDFQSAAFEYNTED
jgi:hypothetical protein